ncbi:hypothetical protein ACP70R_031436 [Stipagrostis hirtigluma subsp. patula]
MTPPSPSFARVLQCHAAPLVVIPVLLLAVIYLVVFPNDLKLQEVFASSSCSGGDGTATSSTSEAYTAAPPVDVRVLLGVLTRPEYYERRALLRLAYTLQPRPTRAVIDIRFVLCRLDREEDRVLVSVEAVSHGDVVVLNCTENMNDGKTYAYFSAVPRIFSGEGERYDYVGKIDDDVYYRLATLADALRGAARRDMYHGFLFPCGVPPEQQFMVGMGYIVSWDIAEWISSAAGELRDSHKGGLPEDMLFGEWLRKGGRGKNVYGEMPRMYDYMDDEMQVDMNCCRHELRGDPDTVAVHKLKDRLKWARLLRFFNATQGLKPSKMFPVDL